MMHKSMHRFWLNKFHQIYPPSPCRFTGIWCISPAVIGWEAQCTLDRSPVRPSQSTRLDALRVRHLIELDVCRKQVYAACCCLQGFLWLFIGSGNCPFWVCSLRLNFLFDVNNVIAVNSLQGSKAGIAGKLTTMITLGGNTVISATIRLLDDKKEKWRFSFYAMQEPHQVK